jgi:hypothetical protein
VTCPSEFKLSMYADGELPESDAHEIREHLSTCGTCSALARALEEENRALVHAFQQIDVVGAEADTAGSILVSLVLLIVGGAVAVRAVLDWISRLTLPAALEWVDPSQTTGQLNLVFNSIAYFILSGGGMLMSIIEEASLVALNALIIFGVIKILRRSMGTSVILGALVLMSVFQSPSYALDVRRGTPQVTVRAGETIDDTLIAFGETINIEGVVNGDVVVFARRINVRGMVKGNVIGFAQRVDVSGNVDGDLIGFAQSVQAGGHIMKDVFGFGQTTSLTDEARVDGNATLFAAEAAVDGTVGRDLTAFGGRIDIRGNIGRNVESRSQGITLVAPARVGGNLTARVQRAELARIADGATVAGKTDIRMEPPRPSRYTTSSFYIWQAIWVAGAFMVGFILLSIFPALGRPNLESTPTLLKAGGIGFLATVATPIAAIIVGITMIGLPLALLAVAAWLVGLYLAKIVLASFVGRALLKSADETDRVVALLVGLLLIYTAVNLPYIGVVINFFLTIIGFGALVAAVYQMLRWRFGPTTPQPVA